MIHAVPFIYCTACDKRVRALLRHFASSRHHSSFASLDNNPSTKFALFCIEATTAFFVDVVRETRGIASSKIRDKPNKVELHPLRLTYCDLPRVCMFEIYQIRYNGASPKPGVFIDPCS